MDPQTASAATFELTLYALAGLAAVAGFVCAALLRSLYTKLDRIEQTLTSVLEFRASVMVTLAHHTERLAAIQRKVDRCATLSGARSADDGRTTTTACG